jgi:hypothetical protein
MIFLTYASHGIQEFQLNTLISGIELLGCDQWHPVLFYDGEDASDCDVLNLLASSPFLSSNWCFREDGQRIGPIGLLE